jgi:YaiO family outer membrane protein
MRRTSKFIAVWLLGLVCLSGMAQDKPAVPADPKNVEIELSTSYERLNHGFAPWFTLSLDVSKKLADRRVIYGALRETSRFSLRDQEVMGGMYIPLSKRWLAQVEASVSPSHRVQAKWSAFGQIGRELGRGWGAQAGFRRTAYNQTSANLGIVTIERYWKKYRAAYSLYIAQLPGTGVSTSHRVQANYYYRERNSIGVTIAAGQELTNLAARGVLRTEARGVALSGRHELNRRWTVNYDFNWNRQGDIYTRKGARVGFRFHF